MDCTQIIRTQILKKDIKDVWIFMSNPGNLEQITPKSMAFKITSENIEKEIYPGMIISYKVTPIFSIPITWVTEITHVKEQEYFIDEQRIGPYRIWHHEHRFEKKPEGVLMTDIVTYVPPFGILGKASNYLFIKKKVEQIFDFRNEILESLFNTSGN